MKYILYYITSLWMIFGPGEVLDNVEEELGLVACVILFEVVRTKAEFEGAVE